MCGVLLMPPTEGAAATANAIVVIVHWVAGEVWGNMLSILSLLYFIWYVLWKQERIGG